MNVDIIHGLAVSGTRIIGHFVDEYECKTKQNCQYHRREGDDLLMEYLPIVIERVTILG